MPRRRRRPAKKHTQLLNRARPHYERLLSEQGGVCAICGRTPSAKRRLDLDHDHRQMYCRGLLCARCNRSIPAWMDSSWCRRAADYLDRGPIPWLEDELSSLS
jgi:Recombination endonuclease VII.